MFIHMEELQRKDSERESSPLPSASSPRRGLDRWELGLLEAGSWKLLPGLHMCAEDPEVGHLLLSWPIRELDWKGHSQDSNLWLSGVLVCCYATVLGPKL